jgi:hypothetical protein
LEPYSIGPVDPDPDPYLESGSRRAKITHKSRKIHDLIRIRIELQPLPLDQDPEKINTDPKH